MMDEVFKVMGSIGLKDETKEPLDKATENADKASGSISSKFVGAAKVIAGAFAAKQLFDFGKIAVEAAAGAKATQAQFEQVFDGIVEGAQAQLDGLAKEVGALPNRLKPSFNSIASFAKVAGMDTQQSLDFTTRAMKAAADTSAFMDKSLEDTTETLKSYLKGNFAVADNLGILSTETTRNAAATELFGKKYQELSGIQQQEVLLKMYEDANKVSGALGQAARESDGFENVMGNLKQAWQDFLAIVGSAILPAVVKVVQGLTTAIQWAGEALKPLTDTFGQFFDAIGNGVGGGPLSQLTEWFSSLSESVTAFIQPIAIAFDALYDILFGSQSLKENADLMANLGLDQGLIDMVLATGEAFGEVISVITDGFNSAMIIVDAFFDLLFGSQSEKENFDLMTQLGIHPDVANLIITIGTTITDVFTALIDGIVEVGKTIAEFWTRHVMPVLKNIATAVRNAYNNNRPLFDGLGLLWRQLGNIVKRVIAGIVDTIKFWAGIIGWALDVISPILDNIVTHFTNYFAILINIINFFIAVFTGDWDAAWQAVQNILEAAWNIIVNAIDSTITYLVALFGDFLAGVIQWGIDIFNSIVEWFGKIPGKIEELWNSVIEFLTSIDLYQIGVDIIQGLIDGVVSMGQSLIDSVIGPVNDAINGVKSFLQIKSPSQKFENEVGKMIPQGVAKGVTADGHLIQDSLDEVASKLSFDAKMDYRFVSASSQKEDDNMLNRVLDYAIKLLERIADKSDVLAMDGYVVGQRVNPHIKYIDQRNQAQRDREGGKR